MWPQAYFVGSGSLLLPIAINSAYFWLYSLTPAQIPKMYMPRPKIIYKVSDVSTDIDVSNKTMTIPSPNTLSSIVPSVLFFILIYTFSIIF